MSHQPPGAGWRRLASLITRRSFTYRSVDSEQQRSRSSECSTFSTGITFDHSPNTSFANRRIERRYSSQRRRNTTKSASGDDVRHDATINVRRAELAAGMSEGEPFVINTQQMQQRCMKVVHVHFPFNGILSNFIG